MSKTIFSLHPARHIIRAALLTAVLCNLSTAEAASQDQDDWHYQTYVDAGYGASNRDPADANWPGKSTSATLNSPDLFLAMGNIRKEATRESRWGLEFGLQAGTDSEGLITSPPPPANEPISNADTLRHFYRANVSYRFGSDRSVRLTGGLINSYIGYESFLAIDNSNFTRGYLLDTAPYFLVGLEAMWDATENIDVGFYLLDSFNYLTSPNDAVSTGLQVKWQTGPRTTLIQNLYYGPEQAATSVEYWLFLTDTIVEWDSGRWLLAAAFDYRTEKQAHLPGQPRTSAWASAAWVKYTIDERMSLAFRPEVYRDEDGLVTGTVQTLTAYTATFKYQLSPKDQRLVGTVELRYDRSSGGMGGFPDGPDNELMPDQALFLVGVQWMFER